MDLLKYSDIPTSHSDVPVVSFHFQRLNHTALFLITFSFELPVRVTNQSELANGICEKYVIGLDEFLTL